MVQNTSDLSILKRQIGYKSSFASGKSFKTCTQLPWVIRKDGFSEGKNFISKNIYFLGKKLSALNKVRIFDPKKICQKITKILIFSSRKRAFCFAHNSASNGAQKLSFKPPHYVLSTTTSKNRFFQTFLDPKL